MVQTETGNFDSFSSKIWKTPTVQPIRSNFDELSASLLFSNQIEKLKEKMMASNRKVMVLPGDGIGNEVMQANMKIIDWLAKHRSLGFDLYEALNIKPDASEDEIKKAMKTRMEVAGCTELVSSDGKTLATVKTVTKKEYRVKASTRVAMTIKPNSTLAKIVGDGDIGTNQ